MTDSIAIGAAHSMKRPTQPSVETSVSMDGKFPGCCQAGTVINIEGTRMARLHNVLKYSPANSDILIGAQDVYSRVRQHHPRLCGILYCEFCFPALQDSQCVKPRQEEHRSFPNSAFQHILTLAPAGLHKAGALALPCQIFALCSGTDAHHAASAQRKSMQDQVTSQNMCVPLGAKARWCIL